MCYFEIDHMVILKMDHFEDEQLRNWATSKMGHFEENLLRKKATYKMGHFDDDLLRKLAISKILKITYCITKMCNFKNLSLKK